MYDSRRPFPSGTTLFPQWSWTPFLNRFWVSFCCFFLKSGHLCFSGFPAIMVCFTFITTINQRKEHRKKIVKSATIFHKTLQSHTVTKPHQQPNHHKQSQIQTKSQNSPKSKPSQEAVPNSNQITINNPKSKPNHHKQS